LKRVPVREKVLKENDRIAQELRSVFRDRGLLALNLISAPGSGKTSLLEQTLQRLPGDLRAIVLTGDIATDNDARRLLRFGVARQITTSGACHLDARMVERGLEGTSLDGIDLLFFENVGNLVCPAGFDLGEDAKIVILSVTEGDDKPLKYPNIMVRSKLMIVNKMDLLPYVTFDLETVERNARNISPDIEIIRTSCTNGDGIDNWLQWLRHRLESFRAGAGRL
jgi:hydrogenase nickel incorporation protein HypB